jgi:hypothetical protein
MTTIESTCRVIGQADIPFALDEDQLAVVAFLARYRGRTPEAYRHDLSGRVGAASGSRTDAGRVGGAVKAGPSGPPVGGALAAPVVQFRQPQWGTAPKRGSGS